MDETLQLILGEIRLCRDEILALRTEAHTTNLATSERLSKLEAQVYPLIDNGRPGQVSQNTRALQKLKEQWKYALGWAVGAGVGAGTMMSAVVWIFEQVHK